MIYFDTDGITASELPFDRDEAKRAKSKKYVGTPCPECGNRERYTRSDSCVRCSELDANDLFCFASGALHFEYHPEDNTVPPIAVHTQKIWKDRVITWEHEGALQTLPRMFTSPDGRIAKSPMDAARMNTRYYVVPSPCDAAGHYGILDRNGRCHFCEQDRLKPSPRQAALRDGKKWYTPLTPCPRCGQIAEKRVVDGQCRGCVPAGRITTEPDRRKSETTLMMEAAPGMILTRTEARDLGLKVFRTGRPCRAGHTGFRWVSTGGCIDCLRILAGRSPVGTPDTSGKK